MGEGPQGEQRRTAWCWAVRAVAAPGKAVMADAMRRGLLAALELGRYAFWALSVWVFPGLDRVEPSLSLTAWFSVLVVFVLAEVFREGARLRREAELTI